MIFARFGVCRICFGGIVIDIGGDCVKRMMGISQLLEASMYEGLPEIRYYSSFFRMPFIKLYAKGSSSFDINVLFACTCGMWNVWEPRQSRGGCRAGFVVTVGSDFLSRAGVVPSVMGMCF